MINTKFSITDDFSSKIENMITKVDNLCNSMNSLEMFSNKISASMSNAVNRSSKITRGIGHVNSTLVKMLEQSRLTNESITKLFSKLSRPPKPDSSNTITTWFDKINKLASTAIGIYVAVKGLKWAADLSDRVMNVDARLNFITDSGAEKSKLKNDLMKVSNDLGVDYLDFSDQVIKLRTLASSTFGSNSEVIRFNELLSKSFKVSGTGSQEASSAMYQLSQAMASGKLQGDEFRSVLENAPMLAQGIAKQMKVPFSSLKDLGAKGKITSDIIKNALFNMGDELDKKFAQLPMSFSQAFNKAKNEVISIFEPISKMLSDILNSPQFQRFAIVLKGMADNFSTVLSQAAVVVSGAFNVLIPILTEVLNLINFLSPAIWGLVTGFATYNTIILISSIYTKAFEGAMIAMKVATAVWTTVQGILNGQLAIMNIILNANPIFLIATGIAIFVGVLKLAVNMLNKFTGSTYTFFGVLIGSLFSVFAIIANVVIAAINLITGHINRIINLSASLIEAIYNIFVDPINAIRNLFLDMIIFVLDGMKLITKVADTVLGTNLSGKIDTFIDKVNSSKKYSDKMIKVERKDTIAQISRFSVTNSFAKGNEIGSKFSNLFNKTEEEKKDSKNLDKISANTEETNKKLDKKNEEWKEDLKLLKDMARRDYIAEVTAPTIKIEISNDNHINTEEDKQNFIKTMTDQVALAILGGTRKGVLR